MNLDSFALGFQGIDSISSSFPDKNLELTVNSPDDDLFDLQTYLQPEAVNNGGAINAVGAWNTTTGDSSQIIGYIDTGIDTDHPDLDAKVAGGSHSPSLPSYEDNFFGHGTAVAGILAAETDNSFGIAGINWAAKLFASRIDFDSINENTFDSDFAQQVQKVINSGAKQINMSISAPTAFDERIAAEALENAWLMDINLIAAKGNKGNTELRYPSDYFTVIGVGALEKNGVLRTNSNWGNDVKLVAQARDVKTLRSGGGFQDFQNTSAAAPQVTAAISPIRAANPTLTAGEAESILFVTAIDNVNHGPGFDDKTGYGTPDVGAAVEMAATRVPARFFSESKVAETITFHSSLTFTNNHGIDGGLASGTYTEVFETKFSHHFTFNFGHDDLIPVYRLRSSRGWPADHLIGSVKEMSWGSFDTTGLNRSGVTAFTAAYHVNDDGLNPPEALGWWPCKAPPCVNSPDLEFAVTVLVTTTPGDADNNTSFNVGDVNYMLAWIFQGGALPPIMNDADASGDCKVNIADVTYMIATIFQSGPLPLNADCVPGSLKPAAGGESFVFASDVALDVGAKRDNKRLLKYNATRKVNALVIRLKALNGSKIEVTKASAKSKLYWSQTGADVIIGLIDPQGQDFFMPSDSDLVEISGDFEIVSVEATDIDSKGQTEYLRPQYVAGKFTSGSDPTIGEFSLDGAFPNPFNPETQIAFSLPISSNVKIEIYNILGQRVITLTDKRFDAGAHRVSWSSQDESGSIVASGMYFAKMTAGDFSASKKLVILK